MTKHILHWAGTCWRTEYHNRYGSRSHEAASVWPGKRACPDSNTDVSVRVNLMGYRQLQLLDVVGTNIDISLSARVLGAHSPVAKYTH